MQDATVSTDFSRKGTLPASSRDAPQGSRWLLRILPLLLFIAVIVAGAVQYWSILTAPTNRNVATGLAVVLSILLALLPAMICVVQNITKKRQRNRLASLEGFPVGKTAYFRTALTTVDAMKMGGVDTDYEAPLFVYFFIVFLGFITLLVGYHFSGLFTMPTVLLGGLKPVADADYAGYQMQTFAVLAMAFLASYIYSLSRLLDRVNNNDLYPISLYYYAVRIVIACVVAAVLRHTADVFGIVGSPLLLLVGFGVGIAPDLFVVAIARRAFQAMKIWGSRDEPSPESRPTSLPLLTIDDLTREKIDRLNELGIDSAQVLARQNPFLLLTRLPYDLGLIVDWIGQAQLYALVRDKPLMALRGILVRDSFDLYLRLRDDNTRIEIAKALEISDAAALILISQLEQDHCFTRLREVRASLLPPPYVQVGSIAA